MVMHGGKIYQIADMNGKSPYDYIDFSVNINPYIDKDIIKSCVLESLNEIEYYPDDRHKEIKNSISEKYDLPASYIYLGNGANDIIYKIMQAFHKPMQALILSPTFSEYEKAILSVYGSGIEYYNMEKSMEIHQDYIELLKSKKNIEIIFICNPNNPTGLLMDMDLLEDVLEYCSQNNIWVVIDECFMDFVRNSYRYSAMAYINKYYNLIILKSFTKIFSIPALRLGFLLTKNMELLDSLNEITPSWNINTIALRVANELINYDTEKMLSDISNQRNMLVSKFKELGFTVYASKANFILFKTDIEIDLYERLLEHNIIIRDCSDYRGLKKGYYRIAIRSKEDNLILIEKLKYILCNKGN